MVFNHAYQNASTTFIKEQSVDSKMDEKSSHAQATASAHTSVAEKAKSIGEHFYDFYLKHYKILVVIPFIVLLLALGQLGFQYATQHDFVNKGIDLKGGVSMTIQQTGTYTPATLQAKLSAAFPKNEMNVRQLATFGNANGFIIESDILTQEDRDKLVQTVTDLFPGMQKTDYTVEVTGPSIGEQLFQQAQIGLLVAFVCMAIVVWIAYKTPFPVMGIILAAASNMIITLAIFNLTGEKLSSAGVAAFLMVLGYSVDTDILLASRLLKRAESAFKSRLLSAIKTSFLMTATTFFAVLSAFIVTNSDVIKQIMFILTIGLIIDVFITYLQNANLLRLYLEKKGEVTIK